MLCRTMMSDRYFLWWMFIILGSVLIVSGRRCSADCDYCCGSSDDVTSSSASCEVDDACAAACERCRDPSLSDVLADIDDDPIHLIAYDNSSLISIEFPLYSDNVVQVWDITLDSPGSSILLQFPFMDIEPHAYCEYDSLEIFDGDEIVARLCGTRPPGQYISRTDKITMVFTSDFSIFGNGFRLTAGVTSAINDPNNNGFFQCPNGWSIEDEFECDYISDCWDESDEYPVNDGCMSMFTCSSTGHTIPVYAVCNGIRDCEDAEDEMDCIGLFFCGPDEDSVDSSYVCDEVIDCNTGNDEKNCSYSGSSCSYICYNDGECGEEGCICLEGWSGEHCEIDIVDNCHGSCGNGTCFDSVDDYFCVCPRWNSGRNCEQYGSHARSELLEYYLNENGRDVRNCGYRDYRPCSTLRYVLSRMPPRGTLLLLSDYITHASVLDDDFSTRLSPGNLTAWISRSVVIQSDNSGVRRVLKGEIIITKVAIERAQIDVTFRDVELQGNLYIGDANVNFVNCILTNVIAEQEYQRRQSTNLIKLQFIGSLLVTSKFFSGPREWLYQPNPIRYGDIVATSTEFNSSRINMTAEHLSMTLTNSRFFSDSGITKSMKRQSSVSNDPMGIYLTIKHVEHSQNETTDKQSDDSIELNTVRVENTIFTQMYQRILNRQVALSIRSEERLLLEILNSNFTHNNRAVFVDMHSKANGDSSVNISNCEFTGNIAGGPGGAIFLHQTLGTLRTSVKYCEFYSNWALHLYGDEVYEDTDKGKETVQVTDDITQVSGNGGAIAVHTVPTVSKSHIQITESIFTANTAETYGGTLYIGPYVRAIISNSSLTNIEREEFLGESREIRPYIGDIVESRGNMVMRDNTFRVSSANESVPVLSYRASEEGAHMESYQTNLICPDGYHSHTVSTYVALSRKKKTIDTLLLYCRPCSFAKYSLVGAHLTMDNLNFTYIVNSTCHKCPYGALCNDNIKAKANFWGEEYDNEVDMYLCPEDYCCPDAHCTTFDKCAFNRTGRLCGKCKDGYSESLYSAECIPHDECTYVSIFWVILAVYGCAYVIFFLLEEEWQLLLHSFTTWLQLMFFHYLFKCRRGAKRVHRAVSVRRKSTTINSKTKVDNSTNEKPDTGGTDDDDEEEDAEDAHSAYLSIFMYYVQIPSLLRISIFYENEDRIRPLEDLLSGIKSAVSFNSYGIKYTTCIMKDITVIYKVAMRFAFVVYLFIVLIVIYLLVKPFCCAIQPRKRFAVCRKSSPFDAKFITAFVSLLLYTYQYLAENSMAMLRCIDVKTVNSSVLYLDANITCYQPWQFVVITFVCIYVIPFAVVLAIAPDLLRRHLIKVPVFIVSLFLPLFSGPYLGYLFITRRQKDRHLRLTKTVVLDDGTIIRAPKKEKEKRDTATLVSRLLSEPYKNKFAWGICWEGVVALRRLLLIVIATFNTSIIFRHLLLVLGCQIALLMQLAVRPFVRRACNIAETLSLTVLLLISIMNFLKSSYFQSGEVPDPTTDKIFFIYDWIEALLLGVVPLGIIGLLILSLLAWPVQKCLGGLCNIKCRNAPRYSSTGEAPETNIANGNNSNTVNSITSC